MSYSVISKKKIGIYNKVIEVDSDKSISIRAFLIGSVSQGVSEIRNVLESDDVFSTIKCLRKLGVRIVKTGEKSYSIFGKGLGSLYVGKNVILDCGNSGTLARLLMGILSTTPNINLMVTGDKSLRKRNLSKLINLMSQFGANFKKNKSFLPINLISSEMPIGINYNSGISAQLKSAVILAGLNSFGSTKIHESSKNKSRNHTENLLLKSPGVIKVEKDNIKVFGKNELEPFKFSIPGDPSSAAFFAALTIFNKKSYLKIKNVCLNQRRLGFYELLKKHGANIKFKRIRRKFNESVGDLHVKSSKVKPLKAKAEYYPATADEYVILIICAALIPGVSIFKGISDLSNKESSRGHEMKKILNQIGIKCVLTKNEIKVYGKKNIITKNRLVKVNNLFDHRVCMATVCLSLLTGVKSSVGNFETVKTSSPSFLKLVKFIGGKFEIKKK